MIQISFELGEFIAMSNMTWFHANNKSKTTQRVMLIPCREMLHRVTIPTNKNITIEAWGGDGGDIINLDYSSGSPIQYVQASGGYGGYVCVHIANYNTATTLPLSIYAGGSGEDWKVWTGGNTVSGGYHGGGDGYINTFNGTSGAGGGGCTEIILTNEDTSIMIVGGGGGAANNGRAGLTYYGGDGGGVNGWDGQQRSYEGYNGTYHNPSGRGGTSTSGGERGGYGDPYVAGANSSSGSSKKGGKGNSNTYAGGGGGAGYYGGGGGGLPYSAGAGGGGSSWSSVAGAINASYGTEDYVEKPAGFGKNGGVRITYYI